MVAIILVLAGLVYAVSGAARARGVQTACLSKLSQIGKAMLLYAEGNENRTPPFLTTTSILELPTDDGMVEIEGRPKEWRDSLQPYAGSADIFFCPADPRRGSAEQVRIAGGWTNSLYTSYEVGPFFDWTVSRDGFAYADLGVVRSNLRYAYDRVFRPMKRGEPDFTHHGNRINEVYFDGHTKSLPLSD